MSSVSIKIDISSTTYASNDLHPIGPSLAIPSTYFKVIPSNETITLSTNVTSPSTDSNNNLMALLYSPQTNCSDYNLNLTNIGQFPNFTTTLLSAVNDSILSLIAYIPISPQSSCLSSNLDQARIDGASAVLLYPYLAPGKKSLNNYNISRILPSFQNFTLPAMALSNFNVGQDILSQLSLYANSSIDPTNSSATHVRITMFSSSPIIGNGLTGFSMYLLILGLVFLLIIFLMASLFRMRHMQIIRRRREYLEAQGITDPHLYQTSLRDVVTELSFPISHRPYQFVVKRDWLESKVGLYIWTIPILIKEEKKDDQSEKKDDESEKKENLSKIPNLQNTLDLNKEFNLTSHESLRHSRFVSLNSFQRHSIILSSKEDTINMEVQEGVENDDDEYEAYSIISNEKEIDDDIEKEKSYIENISYHKPALPPIPQCLPLTASFPRQVSLSVDSRDLVNIPKRASSVGPRRRFRRQRTSPLNFIGNSSLPLNENIPTGTMEYDSRIVLHRMSIDGVKNTTRITLGDLMDAKKLDSFSYKFSPSCAICIDDFEDGDILRVLEWDNDQGCGHAFHAECVDEYLITRKGQCPNCNMAVGDTNGSKTMIAEISRPQQNGNRRDPFYFFRLPWRN